MPVASIIPSSQTPCPENRNLESLAKQLYDYWFVQFDFPDENGRPYKSSGGKMVWNEDIQMSIPFGWNVCRLSDFIGKNNTGDWGTDEPSGNSIEIGCIRGADILSLNDLPKRYIKSNKVEKLLTEWDVVIEVSGGSPVQATGRSAYITPGVIKRNGGNISCSNFCHAFSFKDYRDSAYFFYVWNMFYDNGIMFNYEGKTSGIKNFMTDVFLANKWINAPKTLIVKFYNVIKEIYAKMDANISENNSLVKQRDNLLPLLMNGQVEVKQLNSNLSNRQIDNRFYRPSRRCHGFCKAWALTLPPQSCAVKQTGRVLVLVPAGEHSACLQHRPAPRDGLPLLLYRPGQESQRSWASSFFF